MVIHWYLLKLHDGAGRQWHHPIHVALFLLVTLNSIKLYVPGRLYTVNPIAINSPFANVLTQNKRAICMFDTPEYGPVAFVVIGATMVSYFSHSKPIPAVELVSATFTPSEQSLQAAF